MMKVDRVLAHANLVNLLAVALLLLPAPATVMAQSSSSSSKNKTIIGYYASWQWYDREKLASPMNMDFTKVQRVNFAFFQTDTDGNLYGTDSW